MGKGINEIWASRKKKWSFLRGFFVKSISDKLLFCPLRKQNYRICHSDRAFNARQIEISVEPVSVARGCRFTYRSRWFFFSLKGEEREIILIEEK